MILRFYIIFIIFCFFPITLTAQTIKTFTILPFTLHGPQTWRYLENSVPDMLKTRLTIPQKIILHQTPNDTSPSITDITDATADKLRKKLGTDYLIWGTLTVIGQNCSLDIQAIGPKGEKKPFFANTKIDNLIDNLEGISKQIKTELFSLPATQQPTNTDNIFLYHGKTDNDERWRTQPLNFPSRGMLIGDADNDGKQEIFLLKEKSIAVYHLQEYQLLPIDEFILNHRYVCANINFLPDKKGKQHIAVSAITNGKASSFIFTFTNGKLKPIIEKIPYFLNIIKKPPLYRPVLFGQQRGMVQFLKTSGIVELTLDDNRLIPGSTLKLPNGGNIFNLSFLPQAENYKILTTNSNDEINIFNSDYEQLATTSETFTASNTKIEYDSTLAGGTPNDSDNIKNYFIPTRLYIPDKSQQLLVARNISTAGQFFKRYRSFSQSEIHCLEWNGIELTAVWKTKPINGTTVDYCINQIDGKRTLLVNINIYPNSLEINKTKTVILGYPLERLEQLQKQTQNFKKEKK